MLMSKRWWRHAGSGWWGAMPCSHGPALTRLSMRIEGCLFLRGGSLARRRSPALKLAMFRQAMRRYMLCASKGQVVVDG